MSFLKFSFCGLLGHVVVDQLTGEGYIVFSVSEGLYTKKYNLPQAKNKDILLPEGYLL